MGEGGQVPWTQRGDRGGGEVEVLQGKKNQVDDEQGVREVEVVQGKGGEKVNEEQTYLGEGRNSCKGVPGGRSATNCAMPDAETSDDAP